MYGYPLFFGCMLSCSDATVAVKFNYNRFTLCFIWFCLCFAFLCIVHNIEQRVMTGQHRQYMLVTSKYQSHSKFPPYTQGFTTDRPKEVVIVLFVICGAFVRDFHSICLTFVVLLFCCICHVRQCYNLVWYRDSCLISFSLVCNRCTVCRRLFILLGVIGRLYSLSVTLLDKSFY